MNRRLAAALVAGIATSALVAAGATAATSSTTHATGAAVFGTASPTDRMAAIAKMWRANLRTGATADPLQRFPNPTRATLDRQLHIAARRYHFTIVKVQVFRPDQAAPFVVVQAADEQALAASTPAILHLIDPKARTTDDRTGWAYEGFLFEARDSNGVPFLATFNWWRGPHAGGGQWARDPTLFPFPHG